MLLSIWKRKVKSCSLTYRTLGPSPPAMAGNNTPHICKPNACAFKFVLGMEPLKYSEEFIHIFHVKIYSIVFETYLCLPVIVQALCYGDVTLSGLL